MRPRAALFGLVWTLLAGAVLAFAPFGESSTTTTASSDATSITTTTHESLLAHEGASVPVVLAVPIVLALGGWLAARHGWRPGAVGAAIALGAGVVLALLSVGVFYLPAAIAMGVAGTRR